MPMLNPSTSLAGHDSSYIYWPNIYMQIYMGPSLLVTAVFVPISFWARRIWNLDVRLTVLGLTIFLIVTSIPLVTVSMTMLSRGVLVWSTLVW